MIVFVLMSLTLGLALADIFMKSYVEGYMGNGEERSLFGSRIKLRKVYNKGMCFHFLDKWPEVVKGVSAAVAVLLTIYQLMTFMRGRHYLKKLGLTLMTAGAWSNTFDRWIRGYVIDYVGFKTKWEKITEITYNLGDFFLVAGSLFMVLSSFFPIEKRKN